MSSRRTRKISEVARLSGLSVRALHHYDELGLLVPSGRSQAGYRLYTDDDLLRLQQIVIGRELGLPLEQIRRALDDPSFDLAASLRQQRAALVARRQQTEAMITAIDTTLAALGEAEGAAMDTKHMFAGFDPAKHEDEARRRWGDTAAYRESARRTRGYTEADWAALRAEQAAIYSDAAALRSAGKPAASAEAMAVAERHRRSIDRWFYPCDHATHCGLADLYEHDPRFAANIDTYGADLTPFLSAAIRANAAAAGRASPATP